jgi:hypothetical protein
MRNPEQLNCPIAWGQAFRVLRGVDRDPTDEERMIFNLGASQGLSFDAATEKFIEAMTGVLASNGELDGVLRYDPDTGDIVTVALGSGDGSA